MWNIAMLWWNKRMLMKNITPKKVQKDLSINNDKHELLLKKMKEYWQAYSCLCIYIYPPELLAVP